MDIMQFYPTLSIAFILIFIWGLYKTWGQIWHSKTTTKLPDGPPGVPIVGNMLQFFQARKTGSIVPYLLSMREYGEMTTLQMGSQIWILLNTKRVINDIINKQSRITNQRPVMPISGDLVSSSQRLIIRRTEHCTEARKVLHHLLSTASLRSFNFWQDLEGCQLQLSYLQKPEQWYQHHFRFATAIFYEIIMGVRLDKTQRQLDDHQQITMEFVGSLFSSPIDFFPQLASLPHFLQFWRPKWKAMGEFHTRVFQEWWEPVRSARKNGTLQESFVRDVLFNPENGYQGDDEDAMYLATSVMAAGGDNTRMTMNVFVMAAISYPAAFQRARDEIDSICLEGDKIRMPSLNDMDRMPYLCAFIKEVLRWRPTVPLIPPHELTEDLEYEGNTFRKGTLFLVNNTAVSYDHQDPDQFYPERWLDGNESNVMHGLFAFGGGRRVCIGYRIEQQVLFTALSRLIFSFDYTPTGEYNNKRLNHGTLNEPFPVSVRPRNQQHVDFIMKAAMEKNIVTM